MHGEEIGWLPLQDGFGLGSARLKDWDTQVRGGTGCGGGGQENNHDRFEFWGNEEILDVQGRYLQLGEEGRERRLVCKRI